MASTFIEAKKDSRAANAIRSATEGFLTGMQAKEAAKKRKRRVKLLDEVFDPKSITGEGPGRRRGRAGR